MNGVGRGRWSCAEKPTLARESVMNVAEDVKLFLQVRETMKEGSRDGLLRWMD